MVNETTFLPTVSPTTSPSPAPTHSPSTKPTENPTNAPTIAPSSNYTDSPTVSPFSDLNTTGNTHSPSSGPQQRDICGGYQTCSECVTDTQENDDSGTIWCQWHLNDNYCYNYYTQPVDDIYSGVSKVELCADSISDDDDSTPWISIIVIVMAGTLVIVAMCCIIRYSILRFKTSSVTLSIQPVHVQDTSNTIESLFHKEGGGDPGLDHIDALSVEGANTEITELVDYRRSSISISMVSNAGTEQTLRSSVGTAGSPNDDVFQDKLQRAVQFGKFWRTESPEEMMEEWTGSFIDDLRRIRESLGIQREFECSDLDCRWNEHQRNTVLFPHQLVHALLNHFEGIYSF